MNREERRQLQKFKKQHKQISVREERLKEGQRVKLHYQRITSHPDWSKLTQKYRMWVATHKDDIFTVEYDEQHKDGVLVCLKEDTTEPKWLFYEGDLIEVDDK